MTHESMIIETNQRILNNITEIIKALAHDPEADIQPTVQLIQHQDTSRRMMIWEKRKRGRDFCDAFARKEDADALA